MTWNVHTAASTCLHWTIYLWYTHRSVFQSAHRNTLHCQQVCLFCFVLFCVDLLCFFHKSIFLMGCFCHFQTILTNNYMHIKYKAEYHIVYPIYIVILANSKQIYVPGSVIPTINILDNTSDTTCVELALIDTWWIAALGTTMGCKEWHWISLLLNHCWLYTCTVYMSQCISSISMYIHPYFCLSVSRSIYSTCLYFPLTWRDGDRSLEQVLTASMRISLCSLARKVSAQWRTRFPCANRCPAWITIKWILITHPYMYEHSFFITIV